MSMKTLFAAACAAMTVGLLTGSPAIADDVTESVRVTYVDLDLASAHGTKLLFMRLQDAARVVCGDTFATLELSERLEMQRCQQTAIENAVVQVDRPRLTTMYDRHYPREAIPDTRVSVRSAGEQGLEIAARRA
jgi:UrcA family protein